MASESSIDNHADRVITPNSTQDSKAEEGTSIIPVTSYNPPADSSSQLEKNMKKYVDYLMRFLEGISSRLSQLELHCYNLDKSIGEMKSEFNFNLGEQYSMLKSLEKHLQEIHSSEQIIRVKQELAQTRKELTKLQLAQKESSSLRHSLSNEDRSSPSSKYAKKTDNNASNAPNRRLQIAPQPTTAPAPYNVTKATQQPAVYTPVTPLPGMEYRKKTAAATGRGAGGPVSSNRTFKYTRLIFPAP